MCLNFVYEMLVCKSKITKVATVQNFHFMSHNLKCDPICAYIISSSQQYNKKYMTISIMFEVLTTDLPNN